MKITFIYEDRGAGAPIRQSGRSGGGWRDVFELNSVVVSGSCQL